MDIAERKERVAGLDVHWLEAGERPVLYLHGVPTAAWDWEPFLELGGGYAPDLPGFGSSDKPAHFDYSLAGYDAFLESFCSHVGLDRLSLVMHDWGGAGLAFAQRFPERIERLVLISALPLLPGFRWHRTARWWRRAGVGEAIMGVTTKWALRRELPDGLADRVWPDFDHGTQRAILKLYRSAPESSLAAAGGRLGELRCPALVIEPTRDPYIPVGFGRAYADALGGEVTLEHVDAGHWPWLEHPDLVGRVLGFLS